MFVNPHSMGYIPVIVALLGFITLWGLVNYNSIKAKKIALDQKAQEVYKYAMLRNATLRQLAKIASQDITLTHLFHEAVNKLDDRNPEEVNIHEKMQGEHKVTELIAEIPLIEEDENYRKMFKQLQVADDYYRKVASAYSFRLKDYNGLVTRNPSKIVASLMRFKPVEPEISG